MLSQDLQKKYDKLLARLRELDSVAVAFSGGVDSTLLLKAARVALGENVIAITGDSPSIPTRELEEAKTFAAELDVKHLVIKTHEFEIEGFDHNPKDRCYICKKTLFSEIMQAAAEAGVSYVAEGSNMDDLSDYRPGAIAIEELGVASPLRDAELYKEEIRAIAKELELSVWNKPSFACLNSRFEYGDLITEQKLGMVDNAEQFLREHGFAQVRVRMQGTTARIEVPADDIARLSEQPLRDDLVTFCKELGFNYVSADLQGYRTGSMNETLALTSSMK